MDDVKKLAEEVIEKAEKATPRPYFCDRGDWGATEKESYGGPRIYTDTEHRCFIGEERRPLPGRAIKYIDSNDDAAYLTASANAAPILAHKILEMQGELACANEQVKTLREILELGWVFMEGKELREAAQRALAACQNKGDENEH